MDWEGASWGFTDQDLLDLDESLWRFRWMVPAGWEAFHSSKKHLGKQGESYGLLKVKIYETSRKKGFLAICGMIYEPSFSAIFRDFIQVDPDTRQAASSNCLHFPFSRSPV